MALVGRYPGRRCGGLSAVGVALLLTSTGLTTGCGLVGGPRTFQADVPDIITVTSPDVEKGTLGSDFTCHGDGKTPGLHWTGAPQGTKSFAIVADDSDAPIRPYIYWIVFDINSQQTVVQPGQIPPGASQAQNSKGTVGYDPPCPVKASHTYRFTVYALDKWLKLKSGVSVKTAWSKIAQTAIGRGRLPAKVNP